MSKAKVLFVSQKIEPYIVDGEMSHLSRYLPQAIQEKGKEIRTFMPKFGCINERRYQLHEVIRLSGMNLILDDTDHPLIIKVASIQPARMQVYFIDNEEYFQRKTIFNDEKGKFHSDNDERMAFYCRGVIETVKKLGWAPDIVHCNGWMTSLMPYYLKNVYKDDPVFSNSRVVFSVYDDGFSETMSKNFTQKLGIADEDLDKDLESINGGSYADINKFAINLSDAVIMGSSKVDRSVKKHAESLGKPILEYHGEDSYEDAYSNFYDELLLAEPAFAG